MISVTITFNTPAEAAEFLADYGQGEVTITTAPAEKKPAKTAKAPKKTAAKEAAAAPVDAAAAEEAYEAVKAAALKLTHTKGRDKLVEVLASLGYKTAMDAKPEGYSDLVKALTYATDAEDESLV